MLLLFFVFVSFAFNFLLAHAQLSCSVGGLSGAHTCHLIVSNLDSFIHQFPIKELVLHQVHAYHVTMPLQASFLPLCFFRLCFFSSTAKIRFMWHWSSLLYQRLWCDLSSLCQWKSRCVSVCSPATRFPIDRTLLRLRLLQW
jgi:hypothetical protein